MNRFKIPETSAYQQYWDRELVGTSLFWTKRSDTSRVRSLVARWIVNKALGETTPDHPGFVRDARIELPAALSREDDFGDLSFLFAALHRSGEDDPRAEWMLGAAGAEALEIATVSGVLETVLDLTSNHIGASVLSDEFALKLAADENLRTRFTSFVEEVVQARVNDPAAAVLTSQRSIFRSQLEEWTRHPDIRELLRETLFEIPFSGDAERFALRMLREYDARRFVSLLDAIPAPQIVSSILFDLRDDAQAIVRIISDAPVAFRGGYWTGSLVAPLALREAVGHIEARLRQDAGTADENLEELVAETCLLFAHALANRPDGSALSLRWAVSLIEELAVKSGRSGTGIPPLRSPARAPWSILDTLSDSSVADNWTLETLEDLAPELVVLQHCVRILSAMSKDDAAHLPDLATLIPSGVSDKDAMSAIAKILSIAGQPDDYLYELLGWQIAKLPNQAAQFEELWRSTLRFREAERHRYGAGPKLPDAEPIAKMIWAAGLQASFWLENPALAKPRDAASMAARLSDTALEQCLTRYVPDPFWDAASAYATVTLGRATADGKAPSAALAKAIGARTGLTPQFFRIIHSLLAQPIAPDLIWSSVPGGRLRVQTLVAEASAVSDVDDRYGAEVRTSLTAIRSAIGQG